MGAIMKNNKQCTACGRITRTVILFDKLICHPCYFDISEDLMNGIWNLQKQLQKIKGE